jgi:hypothetical protein
MMTSAIPQTFIVSADVRNRPRQKGGNPGFSLRGQGLPLCFCHKTVAVSEKRKKNLC